MAMGNVQHRAQSTSGCLLLARHLVLGAEGVVEFVKAPGEESGNRQHALKKGPYKVGWCISTLRGLLCHRTNC